MPSFTLITPAPGELGYEFMLPATVPPGNDREVEITRTKRSNGNIKKSVKKIDIQILYELEYPEQEFCSEIGLTLSPTQAGIDFDDLEVICVTGCNNINLNDSTGDLTLGFLGGTSPNTIGISYSQSTCPGNSGTIQLTQKPTPGISFIDYYPNGTTIFNGTPTKDSFCIGQDLDPVVNVSSQSPLNSFAIRNLNISGSVSGFNQTNGEIYLNGISPGEYEVTFFPDSASNCRRRATETIHVFAQENAVISFFNPFYCKNDTNPRPAITGHSGRFIVPNGSKIVFLDSLRGQVDIQATLNQPGSNFDYIYKTDGPCPRLIVNSLPIREISADFEVPERICDSDGAISVTDMDPMATGNFTFFPFGSQPIPLGNKSAGQDSVSIALSASMGAGSYAIELTVNSQGCSDVRRDTFEIDSPVDPQMSYADTVFCISATGTYNPNFVTLADSGTFRSFPPGGIALNPNDGAIQPNQSSPLSYEVYYDYFSNGCPNTDSFDVQIINTSASFFNYDANAYCTSGGLTNLPDTNGVPGTFSWTAVNGNTGSLDLNTNSGAINPQGSDPGDYQITFTPDSAACRFPSVAGVSLQSLNANLSYPGTVYCNNTFQAISPAAISGDKHFHHPALSSAMLDSLTGILRPDLCPPGDYSILCEVSLGSCVASLRVPDSIQIVSPIFQSFDYGGQTLCRIAPATLLPVNAISGASYSAAPGAVVQVDSSSGELSYSGANAFTDQDILANYTDVNGCAVESKTTVPVDPPGSSSFSYAGPLCTNGSPVLPDTNGITGTFAVTSTSVSGITLALNTSTGQINPANSDGGTYTVTFTPADSECKSPSSTTVTIVDMDYSFSYPDDELCKTDVPQLPQWNRLPPSTTFSLQGGGSGLAVDAGTGVITPANSDGGDYQLEAEVVSQGCTTTVAATDSIHVLVPDTLAFDYPVSEICEIIAETVLPANDPAVTPGVTNASYALSGTIAGLTVDSTDGELAYNGQNNALPYQFTITCTYESNGCPITVPTSVNGLPPVQASLNYPQVDLCYNGSPTATPVTIPANGTFALTSGNVNYLNTTDGVISPSNFTLPMGSNSETIEVIFEPGPQECFLPDTQAVRIYKMDFGFDYPESSYCWNSSVAVLPDESGAPVQTSYWNPILDSLGRISSTSGQILPDTSIAGTYVVECTFTDQNCTDIQSDTVDIIQRKQPNFSFQTSSNYLCKNDSAILVSPLSNMSGGTWNTYPGGLDFNTTNLKIDPPASNVGSYTLTYVLPHSPGAGICADSFSLSMEIVANDTTAFIFPEDHYCSGVGVAVPDSFQAIPGATFSSTDSLINSLINLQSGVLDLTDQAIETALAGQDSVSYEIIYASGPGSRCPEADTVPLTIEESVVAEINYISLEYCSNPDSLITLTPALIKIADGTFSSGSLNTSVLDRDSGTVTLWNAPAGTHEITYDVEGAGCITPGKDEIVISKFDATFSIEYAFSEICKATDTVLEPTVLRIDTSKGVSFRSGSGLQFEGGSNLGKGFIKVLISDADTHLVIADLQTRCLETDTFELVILASDEPDLEYPKDEWCNNYKGAVLPIQEGLKGENGMVDGFFAIQSESGIPYQDTTLLDSVSGQIFVESIGDEEFTVLYTSRGICPGTDTKDLNVIDVDSALFNFEKGGEVICKGDKVEILNSNLGVTSWIYVLNGTVLSDSNSALFSSSDLESNDELEIRLKYLSGCTDTTVFTFRVENALTWKDYTREIIVEDGQELAIEAFFSLPEVTVHWSEVEDDSLISFNLGADSVVGPSDTIPFTFLLPDAFVDLTNTVGRSQIQMYPTAFGCTGDTVLVKLLLNPVEVPIFVPELMSPNDDGFNDTWLIQWTDEINPNDYSMEVYNRSGGLVHRMERLRQDWDGTSFNGSTTLPDGVYWWRLYKTEGMQLEQSGGLTIRRSSF